jgi:hypothetical protein
VDDGVPTLVVLKGFSAVQKIRWTALAVVAGACSSSASASANPRPLPFTYNYETLPEGGAEVEQYVDLVPVEAVSTTSGTNVWYTATQFQTELEYGVTDHLELAIYGALEPTPGDAYASTPDLTEGTGLKERLRLRVADENVLPVDIALYGEVVEYETEFELEAKIILQKRIGNLRIAANLWAEREWYYSVNQRDWVVNPTLGATYQVTPLVNLGVDSWLRAEFPSTAPHPRPFSVGPHEYVGPAVMLDFGKIWWSTAVYARVTNLDHTAEPGEGFGPIWVRSVVGIGF